MNYGIVRKNIAVIWEVPGKTKVKGGETRSAIADEVLHGMGICITGKEENGFYPVRTHYGYTGFMEKSDFCPVTLEELKDWESTELMSVNGICADVTSLPKVQGILLQSLFRGALVKVLDFNCKEENGWARVALANGQTGYMRNQYLSPKKYSQAGLWEEDLPQSFMEFFQNDPSSEREETFREALVKTAYSYLGVQYRWGGKSTAGIDCSGLTSISYMQNGVLTYRDASIEEGFPVHEIPREEMKMGDLLYFPGHIAMYIGNQRYIHSTGRIGSGGVVINSLDPQAPDYREDLAASLYAVGSIF